MWPKARLGQESKVNILAAIYASHEGKLIHSCFRGIDECSDFGNIQINNGSLFSKQNYQEVHLHPVDDHGNMAISPNNGAFLLNLGFPYVNFHLLMCTLGNNEL